MIKYVLGFCFSPELDRVVLIKKNRPEEQAGKLNGVGGKVEKGEFPLQAMVREFLEETGKLTESKDWRHMGSSYSPTWSMSIFMMVSDKYFRIDTVRSITDEEIGIYDVGSLTTSSIPTMNNLNWLVQMCLAAHKDDSFSGLDIHYDS
jgi:8-oxo-dGTP diphosphatase